MSNSAKEGKNNGDTASAAGNADAISGCVPVAGGGPDIVPPMGPYSTGPDITPPAAPPLEGWLHYVLAQLPEWQLEPRPPAVNLCDTVALNVMREENGPLQAVLLVADVVPHAFVFFMGNRLVCLRWCERFNTPPTLEDFQHLSRLFAEVLP